MPDDPDAAGPPDAENTSPGSPPRSPEPAPPDYNKPDVGCLVLVALSFIGVLAAPAVFFLGGAPLILPGLAVLLLAVLAPLVNPTERMTGRGRWIGRIVTFLVLAALVAAGWFSSCTIRIP